MFDPFFCCCCCCCCCNNRSVVCEIDIQDISILKFKKSKIVKKKLNYNRSTVSLFHRLYYMFKCYILSISSFYFPQFLYIKNTIIFLLILTLNSIIYNLIIISLINNFL
jgi:hypothetical protein